MKQAILQRADIFALLRIDLKITLRMCVSLELKKKESPITERL